MFLFCPSHFLWSSIIVPLRGSLHNNINDLCLSGHIKVPLSFVFGRCNFSRSQSHHHRLGALIVAVAMSKVHTSVSLCCQWCNQLFSTQPFVLAESTNISVPLWTSEVAALVDFPANCLRKKLYQLLVATNFSCINIHALIGMCHQQTPNNELTN